MAEFGGSIPCGQIGTLTDDSTEVEGLALGMDLTGDCESIDTAFNAELKGMRNCGHGHVHVYAVGTCPYGS